MEIKISFKEIKISFKGLQIIGVDFFNSSVYIEYIQYQTMVNKCTYSSLILRKGLIYGHYYF